MAQAPLWQPPANAGAPLWAFARAFGDRLGRPLPDYGQLHAASVERRDVFWDCLWDFAGIIGEKGARSLAEDSMPGARYFPDARLNFAENLLRRRDDSPALLFRAEDRVRRSMSWAELHDLVSQLQQALAAAGVGTGDRVAAMLPNMPEAVALMLATASLGAIWTSCSPDFGARGVLDRFGQVEPKVFVACDGYWYAGKAQRIADKLSDIVAGLPGTPAVWIVPLLGEAEAVAATLPRARALGDLVAPHAPAPVRYARLPFAHPLYILYSSGTTGVPKCIVHSAGGILVQHLKEHRLHCGLAPGERFFYFTTCGWMMWNWLVSGLASGATLALYDGSPFHPTPTVLFDYAEEERFAVFGTSAKFIDAAKKAGLSPVTSHHLPALRLLLSTGSPLAPESFDYVYGAIKQDLHLASISGGTDLCACLVGGVPSLPVYRGEIQGPQLAMAIDVFDEAGQPVRGTKGELVCTRSFPSMPLAFWNDTDGKKYRAAYFERFPGVWAHGDFAEWTAHGGLIIHGRSDATLNPGGVRIGTAELYAVVERIPEVLEALAVGQDWEHDVRIVLFVRMAEGARLDSALIERIKSNIRAGASPRHVPAKILAVDDIPRTKSGKITELAVREVIHGRPVKNKEALANPEALAFFENRRELES